MDRAIVTVMIFCSWQQLATYSLGADAPSKVRLREFATIPCPNGVHFDTAPYCFAQAGKSLLIPRGKTIEVWDISAAKKLGTWITKVSARAEGRFSEWTQIALSRNEQWLATGNDDGMVQVWSISQPTAKNSAGEYRYTFTAGKGEVRGLALSDDARYLAVVTDNQLRFCELEAGKGLHTIPSIAMLQEATFLPDNKTLATVKLGNAVEKTVALWDARSGKAIREIPNDSKTWGARHLSLSQDGRFLIGTIGTTEFLPMPYIYSWDLKEGRELPRLEPRDAEGVLTKTAISPDGQLLASVGYTNRLVVWNRTTGTRLTTIDLGPRNESELVSVRFSPTGRWLAVGITRALPIKDSLSYTSESEIRLVEIQEAE